MHLKIKKNLDYLIVVFIVLLLVLLKYNGLEQIGNKTLVLLVTITLIKHVKTFVKKQGRILLLSLIFLLFIVNLMLKGGSIVNIQSNFVMILYPIISITFIGYFVEKYPKQFNDMLKSGFFLINGYFLLNVVVLILQLQGTGFMIGKNAAGTVNPMYEDLIAGLLGYSGTHQLSLFFVFVILYNLTYLKLFVKERHRVALIIYIAFAVVFSIDVSIQNFNQAYFFVLPVALFVYYLSSGLDKSKLSIPISTWFKIFSAVIAGVILISYFYSHNQTIKEFIDDNLFDKIDMASTAMTMGLSANGSDERFAMILYGLKNYNGWGLGMGLGNYFVCQGGALGFRHFGQASTGTLICLGGIWFVVILTIYFTYELCIIMYRRINVTGFVLVSLYYIFLGVYCQIFYDNIVALWAIIAFLPIRLLIDNNRVKGRSIYEG